MNPKGTRAIFSSIFAVAVVTASFAVTESMWFLWDGESRLFVFSAAIFLSTWQGRTLGGLLATLLSVVAAAAYLHVGPLTLSVFSMQSIAIVWITDSLISAKMELQHRYQNEKAQNDQLNLALSQIRHLNERLHLAMKETHHRVKNNLQTIALMLGAQARRKDGVPTSEIKNVIAQVRNIGLLHDVLTHRSAEETLSDQVSTSHVISRLLPIIKNSLSDLRITFRSDCDCSVSVRQASSLSVIVNELVSNAVKNGARQVQVKLGKKDEGIVLEVRDDGKGFPVNFNPALESNTGLKVVQELSATDFDCQPTFERQTVGSCVAIRLQKMGLGGEYGTGLIPKSGDSACRAG